INAAGGSLHQIENRQSDLSRMSPGDVLGLVPRRLVISQQVITIRNAAHNLPPALEYQADCDADYDQASQYQPRPFDPALQQRPAVPEKEAEQSHRHRPQNRAQGVEQQKSWPRHM